jgi:LCP family protein required for cell wall assembly
VTEPASVDAQASPDAASASQPDPESASQPDPESGPQRVPSRLELRQARRRERRHPWLRRAMIAVAAGLALVLVLGVGVYVKLNGNIQAIDVSKLLGERPANVATPDKLTNLRPVNILVMGSDTRDLGTDVFGTKQAVLGARSDTTLIVHLSGDRQSAVVVSVPRDSMTRAPRDCKDPNDKVANGPIRMWNANFSLGGPACLIRTFEGNTRIFIDHFMVVNFLGFQSMVDALGSVEVCLPTATQDPESGLHLPAGRSHVTGEQALAFVRARHNMGKNASDLNRIDRQQAFLSAMVQEATSTELLLRPDKLFRFLDAATKSLTTDPDLGNLNALREVAQSVVGLKSSQVRFVTVPIEAYPQDKNRVQWSSSAEVLWASIRLDTRLPGTKPAPGSKPTPTPTTPVTPVLTVTPDKITVQISNGSGVAGLAKQAADDLGLQGFKVKASLTGKNHEPGVTVAYSGVNREKARTVAAAFPDAILVKDATAGDVIMVSLGVGSPNVVVVPNRVGSTPLPKHTLTATSAPTPVSTVTIKARTADTDVCSR